MPRESLRLLNPHNNVTLSGKTNHLISFFKSEFKFTIHFCTQWWLTHVSIEIGLSIMEIQAKMLSSFTRAIFEKNAFL